MIQTTLKWIVIAIAILVGIVTLIVIGIQDAPLIGIKDKWEAFAVSILIGFIAFFVLGIVTQGVVSFIPSYNKKMLDYRLSQMSAIEKQIEVETDVDQRDWLKSRHLKYHKDANGYRRILRPAGTNTFKQQEWKYKEAE